MLRIVIVAVLRCTHTLANAEIRLWVSAASTEGLISAGADAFCDGDPNNPGGPVSTTRAFLLVSAADEIRDMPNFIIFPRPKPFSGRWSYPDFG